MPLSPRKPIPKMTLRRTISSSSFSTTTSDPDDSQEDCEMYEIVKPKSKSKSPKRQQQQQEHSLPVKKITRMSASEPIKKLEETPVKRSSRINTPLKKTPIMEETPSKRNLRTNTNTPGKKVPAAEETPTKRDLRATTKTPIRKGSPLEETPVKRSLRTNTPKKKIFNLEETPAKRSSRTKNTNTPTPLKKSSGIEETPVKRSASTRTPLKNDSAVKKTPVKRDLPAERDTPIKKMSTPKGTLEKRMTRMSLVAGRRKSTKNSPESMEVDSEESVKLETSKKLNASSSSDTDNALANKTPRELENSNLGSYWSLNSKRREKRIKETFGLDFNFPTPSPREASAKKKLPMTISTPTSSTRTRTTRANSALKRKSSSSPSPPPRTPVTTEKKKKKVETPAIQTPKRKNVFGKKIIKCPVPCREEEFEKIWNFMKSNLETEESSCIYVSGVPGTGKTMVVKAVLKALDKLAEENDTTDFKHVYINGLSLSAPQKIWTRLYQSIMGRKVIISPEKALLHLDRYFKSPKHTPVILIVDELDQLLDKDKQQVIIYNLLQWSSQNSALFSFIAIFNTINLPEKVLDMKNMSRLGLDRVVFTAYTHEQLKTILLHYLGEVKFEKLGEAIIYISRKVAAVSGDARRALEIAKRTLEIMEAKQYPCMKAVQETIKELFSAPKIQALECCSTLEQKILTTIAHDCISNAKDTTNLNKIVSHIRTTCLMDGYPWSTGQILAAAMRLCASKLILLENKNPTMYKGVQLNVPVEDLNFVFKFNIATED